MRRIMKVTIVVLLVEFLGVILTQKKVLQSPVADLSPVPTVMSKPTLPSLEKGGLNQNPPSPKIGLPSLENGELKKTTPTPVETWGVSRQIDEHTWTIKVGEDATMATTKEVFEALNEYRKVQGSQVLNWDEKLGKYAQERAKYLNEIKSVDQHQGFNDFMENQDGFNKLGFTALGENISYGYRLNGVHIIEWMYAGDEPHNKNQLDNRWNYVGIGVNELATCLIFGTGKF